MSDRVTYSHLSDTCAVPRPLAALQRLCYTTARAFTGVSNVGVAERQTR